MRWGTLLWLRPLKQAQAYPGCSVSAVCDRRVDKVPYGDSDSPPHDSNRLNFIQSQLDNRYKSSSFAPFVAFIETVNKNDSTHQNTENTHPLNIAKTLCDRFKNIKRISKIDKPIINVTFESFADTNEFVESRHLLPRNLVSYIPNYKIHRVGVVRGVDKSMTIEKIVEGVSLLDDSIKIISIERLKFRPKDSDSLMDSSTIKISFESNFLPKFIYVWKQKCKVTPFIHKVKACYNCVVNGAILPWRVGMTLHAPDVL